MGEANAAVTRKASDVPKRERCRLANCPNAGTGDARCGRCSGPVVWKDELGRRHGNARSCHGCPNDGLGLPVCWAACPGPNADFQTDGQSVVTLGALEDPEGFIQDERLFHDAIGDGGDGVIEAMESEPPDPRTEYDRTVTRSLSPESENACRFLLASLFSLEPIDLLVFYFSVKGYGLAGTARSMTDLVLRDHGRVRGKITKQAAHKRLKKLARESEMVRKFIPASRIAEMERAESGSREDCGRTVMSLQAELFDGDSILRIQAVSKRMAENRKMMLFGVKTGDRSILKAYGLELRDAPARAREAT